MKYGIICLFALWVLPVAAAPQIERIWLTHNTRAPEKVVVNWESPQPGGSVVQYGRTREYEHEARSDTRTRLHHVAIDMPPPDTTYHYRVGTDDRFSEDLTLSAYPSDRLRIGVVANWQSRPDLQALQEDEIDLLLTAGDQIARLWELCNEGEVDCVKPYLELVDRYPELFRSTPVMPVLGNHDKEIRPRGESPPPKPVYDIEATAFRRFFHLPDERWKWHFDFPRFGLRFIALDLHHTGDFNTTWQSCHPFDRESRQFQWYRDLMQGPSPRFIVTLYNEKHSTVRNLDGGAWQEVLNQGTIAISGFGYFAEAASKGNVRYYNTSLQGTGDRYPDPQSEFLESADNYLLLIVDREQRLMNIQIKSLEGRVLRKDFILSQ